MHCSSYIECNALSEREKQRHTEIRARANMEAVETIVRKRRLGWLEHIARMDA